MAIDLSDSAAGFEESFEESNLDAHTQDRRLPGHCYRPPSTQNRRRASNTSKRAAKWCRRMRRAAVLALAVAAVARAQEPEPTICSGDPNLCGMMEAACPASYHAGALITPNPASVPDRVLPPAVCSLPPGGEGTPTGGQCLDGYMCDINNVTGNVTLADFSDACVPCAAGTCCVTMRADNITASQQEIKQALNPAAGFVPSPGGSEPRLKGAVLVYQKPCPRNYQCPEGKVDDASMVGKGKEAGEQCVSQKCHVYQGCPEGTTVPETGNQKVFAVAASLVWYGMVRLLRGFHKKNRAQKREKQRSARNLQLDTSSPAPSLGSGLMEDSPDPSTPTTSKATDGATLQQTTSLWAQARANWQENGLRDTGMLMASAGFDPSAETVRRPSLCLA